MIIFLGARGNPNQRQQSSNQNFKRPGYDASTFEVLKRDALKDIKKEMTEKLLLKKQKPPKATKLIWDPISKFFTNDPLLPSGSKFEVVRSSNNIWVESGSK